MSSTPQEQGIIFEQKKREKRRILIMAALLGICCALTYYFHVVLGVGTVFTHFFYVPIILASLWWRRKGLVIAMFLALLLILSHFFIRAEVETVNDLIRAPMFIVVALVVGILSERIAKVEVLKNTAKELKNAVEERTKDLAKEHNYVRHLIESSPDFQMTLDKNGRIMDVNEAFEHIVGKSREDVIGTSIYQYLPKEETEKAIAQIFDKKKVRDIELTADISGKGTIICNFSGTTFTTPEGELGIYATGRDVTEWKKMEEKREALRKDLEETNRKLAERARELDGSRRATLNMALDLEKTKQELQESMTKLERFNRLAVDRELKMIELKKEMNRLCERLGEKPRYDISFVDDNKITNYEIRNTGGKKENEKG